MSAGQREAVEGALLFMYAADSGLFNTVADIAHKIFSPQTYPCRLCALTHGYFQTRKVWQDFIAGIGVPCRFLHRDEAQGVAGIDTARLPAVYRWQRGGWQLCLDGDAIAACLDLKTLMAAISRSCTDAQEV